MLQKLLRICPFKEHLIIIYRDLRVCGNRIRDMQKITKVIDRRWPNYELESKRLRR
jgi:hypothetical protein